MASLSIILFKIVFSMMCFQSKAKASKYDPEVIYAVRGEKISFGCQFNISESLFTLSWSLDSQLILFHDPQSPNEAKTSESLTSVLTSNGTKVRLWIRNVQFRDAGSYSCRKDFKSFGQPVSCFWELKVQGVPIIDMEDSVFTENAPVLAECCVEYSLELTDRNITWLIGDNRNFPWKSSLPKTISLDSKERVCSTLTFQSSRQHHGQNLQCYAENKLNLSVSSVIRVNYPASVDLLSEKYKRVEKNSSVNITCRGEGNPVPFLGLQLRINSNRWINMNVEVNKLYSTETISTKWFNVAKIPPKESFFRCIAYNNIGASSFSQEVKISVKFLATVEMITESPIIVYKTSFVIECRTSGLPDPDIYLQKQYASGEWYTLPVEASNDTRESKWIFHITEKHNDHDSFRCVANNTLEDLAISKLIVVKYRVTLKDFVMQNLTSVVTSAAVIVFILLTACCVRCCRARRVRQQYSTGTQREYDVLNVVNADYEEPPRPPTRLLPGVNRPVPPPPIRAGSQPSERTLTLNDIEEGYASATLPARGTVKFDVGSYGIKYATVEKKHVQESNYY